MSKKYLKNQQTKKYEKPKKNDLSFYVLAAAAFNLLLSLINMLVAVATEMGNGSIIVDRVTKLEVVQTVVKAFNYLRLGAFMVFLVILLVALVGTMLKVRKAGSLSNYLDEQSLKDDVTSSLVDTLSVNVMKEQAQIEVPDVEVKIENDIVKVKIEKLAGMYQIENLKTDVSSSFKGKYSDYVVTTARVSDNETNFIFILEDVGSDKTFVPKSLDDLDVGSYNIKLQEGLTINFEQRPHLAIFGKTGSKKTTVLQAILLQLVVSQSKGLKPTQIYAIDGKDELRSIDFIFTRYASNPEKILEVTSEVIKEMTIRQKYKDGQVVKRGKMGLKASECGIEPLVLVCDEVSAVLAMMDSKQQKRFMEDVTQICMKGRSLGIYWILANQDPSTNVFPQSIRAQFATKILLGNANQDTQKMALGEYATISDVEDFRGYYVSDGLTKQPQKYFVPNIFKHGLNEIDAFKKASERRESHEKRK